MVFKSYETLDDVHAIVTEQIPEGVNLEYKGSDILINRDANKICKTVSALANSAGGTFIVGIEMRNLMPVRVDDGTPGPSKRDWIYQIINGGTFPAVETIEIRELRRRLARFTSSTYHPVRRRRIKATTTSIISDAARIATSWSTMKSRTCATGLNARSSLCVQNSIRRAFLLICD
ncbi:AlbA family DNA-binding domain-containing protein [Bradyrhizobium sp. HKCCYLS20291]|uniref:AlbA family DNA-binding domain-containing protein n=1 Tax=Bradyrhizobium sp. HKCCYLS20291 TaxID=3420766 RepID=UPI003EC02A05